MIHRQNDDLGTLKEAYYLKKKKDEITIRSSAAEYLTYVASVGNQQDSIEMRYEDENIWLTQKMIIAVGFKVNSERAVQFRKWVNQIAKDYTIKGWVMDDERLKRGTYLTEKYFDEQLERIREIRAS
mgnify:CR=1 FL=1